MSNEYFDGHKYIGPTACSFCGETLDDPEEMGPFVADAQKAIWAVWVLDAWSVENKRAATCTPVIDMGCRWRVYLKAGNGYGGQTADEARIAAATALVEANPTLGVGIP